MIKFVYDFRNQWGYIPNLIKNKNIEPNTNQWWDLALQKPYSQEFRLLKYLKLDRVPYEESLVSELEPNEIGYYPVHINFFDSEIDYFDLMEQDSLERLREGKLVFIFYYVEGDNLDEDIAPAIDALCYDHGVNIKNVRFVSGNAHARHYHPSFIYFPDHELFYRYLHVREHDYVKEVNLERRSKKFTCLNRIGKNWRKLFAASLWQHGLHNEGYFSYNDIKYMTPAADDIDEPLKWTEYWNEINTILTQFEINTPIHCDDLSDMDHNNHKLIDERFFQDSYWHFVVESYFDRNTLFLTEKTFKPILNLQPFIIVGNPGSIHLLRDLGYKTFDNFINEKYDGEQSDEKRLHSCFTECYKLVHYTHESHMEVMHDLKPILEHNQALFLKSKKDRLNTLLDQLR